MANTKARVRTVPKTATEPAPAQERSDSPAPAQRRASAPAAAEPAAAKPRTDRVRLGGLWQSERRDTLFTGRLREEEIRALLAECEAALAEGRQVEFSLWVNDRKNSPRAPKFTLYAGAPVSSGSGRYGRGGSGAYRKPYGYRAPAPEIHDEDSDTTDDLPF